MSISDLLMNSELVEDDICILLINLKCVLKVGNKRK